MEGSRNAALLRIFLEDSDMHDGRPLYDAVIMMAKEHGIAGVTVLKGVMGFGRGSRVHTSRILALSTGMPVVVEIIDEDAKVKSLMPKLMPIVDGRLVTLERLEVVGGGESCS